jgi:putative Mg2+ transporter-C (MgtC) family protein
VDAITLPPSLLELLTRLALATLLGATIGTNRELQLKPAGLRTHALVALGAALASLTGLFLTATTTMTPDAAAVSRVLQGIVAGVGFIGGGVILRRNDPKGVHGLTTAASIWVVASVGVAAGLGLWRLAVATVALVLLIFTVGGPMDRALHRWRSKAGGEGPTDDD